VNGGTEGVAELFAAMVQRADPAVTLVGLPTAGIDALPTWVDLGPDHVLQLPGTHLSLADGTSWGRVGVVPDVVVQPVEGSRIVPPPAAPADLQVDAALRVVSGP
jgi:C-terminal processing protease CtpA/Prc